MKKYDEYLQLCEECKSFQENDFFQAVSEKFNVSIETAYNLWYAEQRGWFKPEMFDELIRLDSHPDEFQPPLFSGEFKWENGKFVHEN